MKWERGSGTISRNSEINFGQDLNMSVHILFSIMISFKYPLPTKTSKTMKFKHYKIFK